MRIVFCAVPALILGGFLWLLHPAIAALGFVCLFGLGWDVTRPRSDRGECASGATAKGGENG